MTHTVEICKLTKRGNDILVANTSINGDWQEGDLWDTVKDNVPWTTGVIWPEKKLWKQG